MKTTRLLLIICLFANTLSIAAQENPEKPEKIEKGWEFIDAQEFREAVSLMNDYMKQDSVNAEAYHLRGNAYFDLELYDSALIDYLNAIRVDSLYSSAYYNVANTLEIQEDYAKAESYFEQYMAMAPGDADGYLRLAIIKSYLSKPTKDLLVKTLELDSQNITALYYLSMEYLREADYEASIELAEKGKVWYPQQPAFAQVSGLNHYEMGEYQKAAKDFDFVLSLDPVDFSALDMKVRIELLLKTPKELYTKEKDEIRFVPANGNTLLDWVNRQDVQESQYDFEQIKSLMMAGESLSIDQYLYFYVKQKDQPDYGPYYSGVRKTLSDQYNKEEYEKAITGYNRAIDTGRMQAHVTTDMSILKHMAEETFVAGKRFSCFSAVKSALDAYIAAVKPAGPLHTTTTLKVLPEISLMLNSCLFFQFEPKVSISNGMNCRENHHQAGVLTV